MNKAFPLQENISKLEDIERYFQKPDMDLEEAIRQHKEALEIAKKTLAYLDSAENELQKIDISSLKGETL
jgi:exonuclease VII small subunit